MPHLLVNLLSRGWFEEMGISFNNETYKLEYNNKVIGYMPKI